MMMLIGLFGGIRDIAGVSGLFVATSAMILFGLLMERQQSPDHPDWSAFCGFAVNMALQCRRTSRWRDYLFGERAYITLSLVSKSLLG
jgi:hypothetical protein